MTSVPGRRDPKPRGFSEDVRRETPRACTFHISAKLKKTMRGNHPLLWSVFFSGPVPADERGWSQRRRRRRKFRLLCRRMCSIAKREIWARTCQSFMKHSQACAHRNACSSFPWRGRAGWPSGSSARPRSSSPGVKHSVVIVLRSIKKNPRESQNTVGNGSTLTIMIKIENPHQQAWNTVLVCAGFTCPLSWLAQADQPGSSACSLLNPIICSYNTSRAQPRVACVFIWVWMVCAWVAWTLPNITGWVQSCEKQERKRTFSMYDDSLLKLATFICIHEYTCMCNIFTSTKPCASLLVHQ